MSEIDPASDWCQRWNDRQHSWRHRSEGGFDADAYMVEAIPDDTTAKAFVVGHHYAGSYPSAKWRYGLYDRDGRLVGVAVYSTPTNRKTLTSVFPELAPFYESTELGRFVLLDEVPANAESWFLARTFTELEAEGVRGVVSMSDPMPRTAADGRLVMPGHVGCLYQASNARYVGRAYGEPLALLPDGTVLSRRAMQKVRKQERGHEYVERTLVAFGARPMRAGEQPREWLKAAIADVGVRRLPHRGNHRYAFPVGTRTQKRRCVIAQPPMPYPKVKDAA